jgi:CRP-like cAMP-binding protein
LWDLLGLKLGKDPKNTVKIFQGLSNREARIAALLASIIPYPKGHRIITEGEIGAEMFVIVKGKVKIYSGDEDDSLSIAILGPGDNFGETDLVRRGPRWTSAVALDDVELLAIDQKSLTRIERRYPRIALRIYFNLTRIVSDRLQITTLTAMLRGKE